MQADTHTLYEYPLVEPLEANLLKYLQFEDNTKQPSFVRWTQLRMTVGRTQVLRHDLVRV